MDPLDCCHPDGHDDDAFAPGSPCSYWVEAVFAVVAFVVAASVAVTWKFAAWMAVASVDAASAAGRQSVVV